MKMLPINVLTAVALSVSACASDDDAATARPTDEGAPESAAAIADGALPEAAPTETTSAGSTPAGCERGTLEPDFASLPMDGPGMDDGVLRAGAYLFSTTYLQLKSDDANRQLFDELTGPVIIDLRTRAGLQAVALGNSEACGVVRTLGVWQDEVAMMEFVTGAAHAAAMVRVDELSRGGSATTHWLGDETTADWAFAARQLAASDGPLY